MPRGLVAISASAVAAIYMAGYLRTQAADAGIEAAAVPTLAVATSAPIVATAPQPTSTPVVLAPAATATPSQAAAYKDGTFSGQGTSRRGDVWVSVGIQGGRITNVSITRSTLQYPLRDIANLPSQVVQRQSAQVDIVSRATYSSTAFRGAVTQALASARA
jgi:uncharacterized protein with FMN-binding domain